MVSIITSLITASSSLTTDFDLYLFDASSNSITVTLPNIPADGMNFFFKRRDLVITNTVTIQGFNNSQTIDGNLSVNMVPTQGTRLISFGGVWYSASSAIQDINTSNYIDSYDTTTQVVSVANTYQPITFSNNNKINGWSHTVSTSSFTCNQTGTYVINYNATILDTSVSSSSNATLVIFGGGVELANSQTYIDIEFSNQHISIHKCFMSSFTNGDVVTVQFTGSTTSVSLNSLTNTSGSTIPSISLTITRIS